MNPTYNIKHIKVDFTDHIITSNGVELSIDLKAVMVLQMLIEHEGTTVHSNDFMDQVWHDKPSSPEVIPAAIARLRKMFKQAGISEDLIVTVHKVGYRFEAPIDANNTTNITPPDNKSTHKTLVWLLLIALLGSLAFIYQQNRQETGKSISSANQTSKIIEESKSNVTQIYILRHTEKADETSENPVLSPAGIARAKYWKKVLQHTSFDQVFTTEFKRNIQTANLIASNSSVKPEMYYPMSFDVVNFMNQIKGQTVLIIGHSNTIPDMVNRLINETKYPPMSHQNYNILYTITINENGETSSSMLHIEMPETT
ncbi:winged helix-turn-helix domain-containing protein [Marinicella litoralis]|uniref:DNA-binding winged helix-turn-helix (WHTH) protein n=1 Tax=Marinicella litoralis TaxID=644220 RepID=A0A4R6XAZ2_9GAMM|nr:winged helix-turn-helix domain-containing protein [Marinicella litoralis]TDR16362.1 DNA-binding winged helix-turn-helix (wHTH) protein [Marinicella litoralis]